LLLAEGWSQLNYVEVNIEGLPDKVTALNDSGCQLCVVCADVTEPLQLPKLAEAKMKGISNKIVSVDIVSVRMILAQGKGYTNVTCAVVKNLSHCLILGSDVVDRLNVKICDEQSGVNVTDIDRLDNDVDNDVTDVNIAHCSDDVCDDVPVGEHQTTSDGKDEEKVNDDESEINLRKVSADILISEQRSDRSLAGFWSLAQRQKAGYFIRDGIYTAMKRFLQQVYHPGG